MAVRYPGLPAAAANRRDLHLRVSSAVDIVDKVAAGAGAGLPGTAGEEQRVPGLLVELDGIREMLAGGGAGGGELRARLGPALSRAARLAGEEGGEGKIQAVCEDIKTILEEKLGGLESGVAGLQAGLARLGDKLDLLARLFHKSLATQVSDLFIDSLEPVDQAACRNNNGRKAKLENNYIS